MRSTSRVVEPYRVPQVRVPLQEAELSQPLTAAPAPVAHVPSIKGQRRAQYGGGAAGYAGGPSWCPVELSSNPVDR